MKHLEGLRKMLLDDTTGREYEEVEQTLHGQLVTVRRYASGPSIRGMTYNTLDMFSRTRDTKEDREDTNAEQEEMAELLDAEGELTSLFKKDEVPF